MVTTLGGVEEEEEEEEGVIDAKDRIRVLILSARAWYQLC
jgi:hypothetical protein